MKLALLGFYSFLKAPRLIKLSRDKHSLFMDYCALLLLCFLFYAALTGIYYILLGFKLIKVYEKIDFFKQWGIAFTFFFGCILAPVIEEFLFRWHLRKRYAGIYFFFLSGAIIFLSNTEELRVILTVFALCLGTAITIHLILKTKSLSVVQSLWRKSYAFLFYFSAVFFGYLHLSNIKGLTVADPSFVLYIALQIFGGLALGYLRIKYGLKYSMLFHACYNLITLSIMLLFI